MKRKETVVYTCGKSTSSIKTRHQKHLDSAISTCSRDKCSGKQNTGLTTSRSSSLEQRNRVRVRIGVRVRWVLALGLVLGVRVMVLGLVLGLGLWLGLG